MKKKAVKKLVLAKETVRNIGAGSVLGHLEAKELANAQGAGGGTTGIVRCTLPDESNYTC